MRFFRIVLDPVLDDSELELPSKFVRIYGHRLPKRVRLVVPGGRKWRVSLVRKDGGAVCLSKGWPGFAESLGLQFGHLLMFGYKEAKRAFRVIVMDRTACEIQYRGGRSQDRDSVNPVLNEPLPESHTLEKSEEHDDDDVVLISSEDDPVEVGPSSGRERRSKPPVGRRSSAAKKRVRTSTSSPVAQKKSRKQSQDSYSDSSTKKVRETRARRAHQNVIETSDEDTSESNRRLPENDGGVRYVVRGKMPPGDQTMEAFKRAEAIKYQGPVLIIRMHKSYLSGSTRMYMPKTFITRYFSSNVPNVTLKIRGGGQSWSAGCGFMRKQGYLCGGWKKFAKENDLAIGDVCAFELVNEARNLLRVTIFRASGVTENEDCDNPTEIAGKAATPFSRKRPQVPCSNSARAMNSSADGKTAYKKPVPVQLKYLFPAWRLNEAPIETRRALQRAEALKSNHPTVTLVMYRCFVTPPAYQLGLPTCFVRRCFNLGSNKLLLKVGKEGMTWSAEYTISKSSNTRLKGGGWRSLVTAKGLEVGDVCVFELLGGSENLVQVHIFRRAVEDERSC